MYFLRRLVPGVMCCFAPHDVESSQPGTLHSLPQRGSPASAALPSSSIPNITATKDDLRKIFASPSTPGGYNAARAAQSRRLLPQGSLDLNFQFGQLHSRHKKQGSLEQLSLHLKEKLSSTRLKRSASRDKPGTVSQIPTGKPLLGDGTQELAASQRSTGLTDLLTARAAEEGGYDSDAHSIRTPVLRSNVGTLRASPALVREAQKSIELQELYDSPEQPVTNGQGGEHDAASDVAPMPRRSSLLARQRLSSTTRIDPDESPTDRSLRPNMDVGNDTVKALDTPELDALVPQNTTRRQKQGRLSPSAPRRVSSLGKSRSSFQSNLDRLGDRVDQSSRDLADAGTVTRSNSLLSDLGPALLEYLQRCATASEPGPGNTDSSPVTAIRINQYTARPPPGDERLQAQSTERSGRAQTSGRRADSSDGSRSLHLYDMRISQRLVSSSAICAPSASVSKGSLSLSRTSTERENDFYSQGLSNTRYASFIASEPNRRPSDPGTKRLFETAVGTTRLQLNGQDRMGVSDSASAVVPGSRPCRVVDDSSSVYSSGPGGFDGSSVQPLLPRTTSLKNQNSIAIGGRSASAALPPRELRDPTRSSSATEWQLSIQAAGATKGTVRIVERRSLSLPWQRRLSQCQESPTPKGRKHQYSTDDNEKLSFEGLPSEIDRRRPCSSDLSTQAAVDHGDESLSEVNYRPFLDEEGDRSYDGNSGIRRSESDTPAASCRELSFDRPKSTSPAEMRDPVACEQNLSAFPSSKPTEMFIPMGLPKTPDDSNRRTVGFEQGRAQKKLRNREASGSSDPCQQPTAVHVRKRSHSTGDIGLIFRDMAEDLKPKHSMPLLSSKFAVSHPTIHARFRSNGLKKVSFQSLVRKLSIIKPPETSGRTDSLRLRKSFGLWSSFPSHGRTDKKRSTAVKDGAPVCDFQDPSKVEVCQSQKQPMRQSMILTPARWLPSVPKLRLSRATFQSKTFAASAGNSEPGGRGVAESLYRQRPSSSSDLKVRPILPGYKTISSSGCDAEHATSKSFLGRGPFYDEHVNHQAQDSVADGTTDSNYESTSELASFGGSDCGPASSGTATDWTGLYAECIGSLSALRSQSSAEQSAPRHHRRLNSAPGMRETTLDFQTAIEREVWAAEVGLLNRSRRDNQKAVGDETRSAGGSVALSMPGSFE